MTRKILILAANPKNSSEQRFSQQVREIDNALQRAKYRNQFELVQKWAVRPRDIQRAMLNVKPQIVHFLGRAAGSQEGELENKSDRKLIPLPEDDTESEGIVLEDETGSAKLVRGKALAALFELFADKLECVLLNGCYSKEQAEEIGKYIPYVIGTKQVIGNEAAIDFAVGFYDALGAGLSVEDAYKHGFVAIKFKIEEIAEHLIPLLHKKNCLVLPTKPKPDKSETLEQHYQSVIKAIIRGQIVPFLGSDINLCDRPIQNNGELESWEPSCSYPPSDKDLAAYLAEMFPLPIIVPPDKQETETKTGKSPDKYPLIPDHAILIGYDSEGKRGLHVGGEPLQYLSQYADLTEASELYYKLQSLECNYQPNQLHKFFATLPAIMHEKGYYPPYPLMVTSNYDCTLERAFIEAKQSFDLVFYSNASDIQEKGKFFHRTPDGNSQEIQEPNKYQNLSFDKRPVILKLYGTADQIKEGESLVITEDNYIEYLVTRDLSNFLPPKLLKKLHSARASILFLGYPLDDWNQRIILHRIWQNLKSTKLGSRWWTIQSNAEPLAQKLWQSYDVIIHDVPLNDYITKLEQRLLDIPAKGG
ncbi:MAG: SIR2 family protein [Xenococcus sp. (in: cyanobacteria)]